MEQFLTLSAIYLFAPRPPGKEDPEALRRELSEKMPDVAIGEIRKVPNMNLYEIQLA